MEHYRKVEVCITADKAIWANLVYEGIQEKKIAQLIKDLDDFIKEVLNIHPKDDLRK